MPRRPLCAETNPVCRATRGPTGWRDAADQVHPLIIPQTRIPPGLGLHGNEILLAQRGGIALPKRKQISELFLYDADMDQKIQAVIAKQRYNVSDLKYMSPVKSWNALANKILSYKAIDHLILSFHSYSGGLMIGNVLRDLDQNNVKSLFTDKSDVVPTQAIKISIDGCNVAKSPRRMASFAQWFKAESISGYTWFVAVQQASIKIPKGMDEASIKNDLAPYKNYIISALPDSLALARRCRTSAITQGFVISYGSEDGSAAKFPLESGQERKFKPLSSAQERTIRAGEVDNLQQEYDLTVSQAFEHVTITFR